MKNRKNRKAIVVFSEDNLFLVRCLHLIKEINRDSFIERVHEVEDLSIFLSELVIEKFDLVFIIIDYKVKGDSMAHSFRELEKFNHKIELKVQLGMDNLNDLMEFLLSE
jgi:hypothetical protein